MTKKMLVLYATREGQTGKIAAQIVNHLRDAGVDVDVVDAAETVEPDAVNLATYDQLVFGASMHAGGLENELVDFINQHRQLVGKKARSFFLVLLSAATKDPVLREAWLADARKKMTGQLQVSFDDVEMIAGALMYSKYSLPMKWLMKSIAKKAGEGTDISRDYEYTDWNQVKRYADKLRQAVR